ncbi:MAG: hypothetical protein GF411_08790 [Candidatus Lokiarchaeota archaeon]|nr:hypothetical protein [Candidatus Lokiarchaeota archaeon]
MQGFQASKIDYLFISENCDDCALIKIMLKEDATYGEIVALDGSVLAVINAYSNEGSRIVLDKFGLNDKFIPCLLTHGGHKTDDVDEIINYLQSQHYTHQ